MSIQINGTSGISGIDGTAGTPALQGTDSNTGISFGADEVNINTGGTTRATVDSSGRVLVGTSTAPTGTSSQYAKGVIQGNTFSASGTGRFALQSGSAAGSLSSGSSIGDIFFADNGAGEYARIACEVDATPGTNDYPGRIVLSTTADGAASPTERMRIRSDGSVKFETANIQIGGGTGQNIFRTGADGSGIHFTTNGGVPTNETGTISDNTETWGNSGYRWSVIYAATGTINTSDANEKQDIQDLSAAELAVAKELKNLFKTFKWKHAVDKKGDNARIHVGVIAQDVQQLFADHGLDVTKYGLWCSDTWYEVDGMAIASDGTPYTADSEGAVARTRLGIRYEELLAFVLAAL